MPTLLDRFQPTRMPGERRVLTFAADKLAPGDDSALPQDDYAVAERKKYQWDHEAFAHRFFPHLCTKPFSKMHKDFFARWDGLQDTRGWRDATAAPRGGAKTTLRTLIKPVHDIVYRQEPFTAIISSRYDLAEDRTKDIREELEFNEALIRVFGTQKSAIWNQGYFQTRQGMWIMAAARGQQVRGLNRRGIRPSKIILDDAERSDEVLSEEQRKKFMQWLTRDVIRLGRLGYTNYDMVGTILHPQSALAQVLENPGWNPFRYRSVLQWADQAPELWQDWRDLYTRSDIPRDEARAEALAFFKAHEQTMLAGHEVLWPEEQPYYLLMEMILTDGQTAFEYEQQNNPIVPEMNPFTMDTAGYFTLTPSQLLKQGSAPIYLTDLVDLVAFWDPALGARSGDPDYSCCVILGEDRYGYQYVLDCYLSNRDGIEQQLPQVAELLWRWQPSRVGIESNNFQSLLPGQLRQALAQVAVETTVDWSGRLLAVANIRNKVLRIMTLQPSVANRWLWFNARLPGEFLRQFREFIPVPDAGKDDAPDAVEGAVRVMKLLLSQRDAA